MPAEEDHVDEREGPPTNEGEGRTFASYGQNNSPTHLSAPSQFRRIRRSATCYPHILRSFPNSLASRGSFQIDSFRHFECSEGRNSFLTGLSSRVSSENSFWGCASRKSEEYMSARSGSRASSAPASQGLPRGPRGAGGSQLTQSYSTAFREASSEANVTRSVFEHFTEEETQRWLSAPGLLLTAVPLRPSSSLPATASQLEAQSHSLHSIRASLEQAAAAARCGSPHAQLGKAHLSSRSKACEPAEELRAASDQLEYKGSFRGRCFGDHPAEEGQSDCASRQASSPSCFVLPLQPQAVAADHFHTRGSSLALSEAPCGSSGLRAFPSTPSPDRSDNARVVSALGSSEALGRASPRPPHSRLTLNRQHSPGGQDATGGRAKEEQIVTSTFAGRRSSSWTASFREPISSRPLEPTRSAGCLATEVLVVFPGKPLMANVLQEGGESAQRRSSEDFGLQVVADPTAATRDAVQTSLSLTARCRVNGAFNRSASSPEGNTWKRARYLSGAAVCRASSSKSHEERPRRGSCSRGRSSQSMSSSGARGNHGDFSRSSSDYSSSDCSSSSSENSLTHRSCRGSPSCTESVSSSHISRSCSSVRSGMESSHSDSSGSVSSDSRFCSPMELAEVEEQPLEDEVEPEDVDSHSDATPGKPWSPRREDVSNGEGARGETGAGYERPCEGGAPEQQASGVSCMAVSSANADEDRVAVPTLPRIYFNALQEDPIERSPFPEELAVPATATESGQEVEARAWSSHEDTMCGPTLTALCVQDINLSFEAAAEPMAESNAAQEEEAGPITSVRVVSVTSASAVEDASKDTYLGGVHDLEGLPASAASGKTPLADALEELLNAAPASRIGEENEVSPDCLQACQPMCHMARVAAEPSERARHPKVNRRSLSAFFDTRAKRKTRKSSHSAFQSPASPDSGRTSLATLVNRSASETLLVISEKSAQPGFKGSGPLDTSGAPRQAQKVGGCISPVNPPGREEAVLAEGGVGPQQKSSSFPSPVARVKLRRRHSAGSGRRPLRGQALRALKLHERFPLSREETSRLALLNCLKLHECIPLKPPVTRRLPSIAYSIELTEDEDDDDLFEEEGGHCAGPSASRRSQVQRKASQRESSSPPFGSSCSAGHTVVSGLVRRRASWFGSRGRKHSPQSRQFSLPKMPRAPSRTPVHAHGSEGNQVHHADIHRGDSIMKTEQTRYGSTTARLSSFDGVGAGPQQQVTRGASNESLMTGSLPSATSSELGQASSQATSGVQANFPPQKQTDSEDDASLDESKDLEGSDGAAVSLETSQASFLDDSHTAHGLFVPSKRRADPWVLRDDTLTPAAAQTVGDDPTGPQELQDTGGPNAGGGSEDAAEGVHTTHFLQAESQEVSQGTRMRLFAADRDTAAKVIQDAGEKHVDLVESSDVQECFHDNSLELSEPRSCGPLPARKDAALLCDAKTPPAKQTASDGLANDIPHSRSYSSFLFGDTASADPQAGESLNVEGVRAGISDLQAVLESFPKPRRSKRTASSSSVLSSRISSINGGSHVAAERLIDECRAVGPGERVLSEPVILQACDMSELQQEGLRCSSRQRSDGAAGDTSAQAGADGLRVLVEPVSGVQVLKGGHSGSLLAPSSALTKVNTEALRQGQGLLGCMKQLSLRERVVYPPSDDSRQSSSGNLSHLLRASTGGHLESFSNSSIPSGEVLENQSLQTVQESSLPATAEMRGALAPSAEVIAEDTDPFQDLPEDVPRSTSCRSELVPLTTKCSSEPALELPFDVVTAQRHNYGKSISLASAMTQVGDRKTPLLKDGSKPKASRSLSFSGLPTLKSPFAHNKPREPERASGGREPTQVFEVVTSSEQETFGAGHGGDNVPGKWDDHEAQASGSECTERQGSKEEGSVEEDAAVHSDGSHRSLPAVDSSNSSTSGPSRRSSGSDDGSSHGGTSNISREPTFHDALSSGYFGSGKGTTNYGDFRTAFNSLNSEITAVAENDEGSHQTSPLPSAPSEQTLPRSTDGTHVAKPEVPHSDRPEEQRPMTDPTRLENSAAADAPWREEESASAFNDESGVLLAGAGREPANPHLTADHPAESTADHTGGPKHAQPSGIAAALSSLARMIFLKPPDGPCQDGPQQQSASAGVIKAEPAASREAQQRCSLPKTSSETEAAAQDSRALSEEREAREVLQGDALKESKQRERHQLDEPRPAPDDGADPVFSLECDEHRMVGDHDVPRENSGQLIRDPAPPWKKKLADAQAVRSAQLANEAAQRMQHLAAERQLKIESSSSDSLACGGSRPQSEGSSRSSSSGRAPRSTGSSEPKIARSSSAHPLAEDLGLADEAANGLESPDAEASRCATEAQGNQSSCLKSPEMSENAVRLLREDMRPRRDDFSNSPIAEIAQSSAEEKGDHITPFDSRRALVTSPGKNKGEARRLSEIAPASQSSGEYQLSSDKLRVSFDSDAPVARKLVLFKQGQEEGEFEGSHNQPKRAKRSDSTLERARSGRAQAVQSASGSFKMPAGPARRLPDDASTPLSNKSTRRGIAEASRVLDGAVAHALRTPCLMRRPQDAGVLKQRAKLDLLLGEAEKWGLPEATTAALSASGGAEGRVLEKSLSCASEAAAARRLALQQPALTCSMPPIFCNPCLFDSSLWNLQLRRQFSPKSKPVSIPGPEHALQEDGFHLPTSARRGSTDCGHASIEEADRSAGLKCEQHEGKPANRKSSGSLVKEVVNAPALPPSARLQDLFEEEVGQASIRQARAAFRSLGTADSPSLTMGKPRRPWACGEAPSVASEEPKPPVRTYIHKPGCRCSLCLSPGWGVPGSPRITEVSTPRMTNGLPVVPVQPGGYAVGTPMRILSSPIGPQPFYRLGGGGTTPFESAVDATYDSHTGALTARSYYDTKTCIGGPESTLQHTYSPQQLHNQPIRVYGCSEWQSSSYQNEAPRMNITPSADNPVVPRDNQIQGEDQPYGTPSFAVSPASRTPVSEGIKSNAASSPIPSRGVSSEEAEKIRLQQEYKEQQEEFRRRQEELEQQRARQQEEIEIERRLLKEQRERLERQREEFEREKQEILQARLQSTLREKNSGTEQGGHAAFASSASLTGSKGETETYKFEPPRRQHGPPQRHTSSTSNIVRSITGSGLGQVQSTSRLGSVGAEADAVEDKEGWNAGNARHHQQQSDGASRFFSRAASVDTMDEKETTASPLEDLHTDPSMALSAALDKVAQIRVKLDTLQQQLEVQSHEVASYYNSLKAAEQVHGSLQQTAADCRVCFGRRNTQLQEVDKRLGVLTAQDLHPCSLEELEELAQELEGTQYKLTVVQAQRSGGAVEDNRQKPKQLLPYSSSCLPEPKSSFAIPEEPVSRIGPDECVAMQESVLQEIKVLAEDLDHIKSVHLQFKKAYKRLQGLMTQEVNSYDVDLQRLVAIEKNLEDKLRRLLFLNGDANYSELSDSQMQEYFRTVNQSIRKVYREIALRESGDRRPQARTSGGWFE
ncbi:hypothetical protein ACSSS7_006300 [Eimeria intestinalis]